MNRVYSPVVPLSASLAARCSAVRQSVCQAEPLVAPRGPAPFCAGVESPAMRDPVDRAKLERFLAELGRRARSVFIARHGAVDCDHFDAVSQALTKLWNPSFGAAVPAASRNREGARACSA